VDRASASGGFLRSQGRMRGDSRVPRALGIADGASRRNARQDFRVDARGKAGGGRGSSRQGRRGPVRDRRAGLLLRHTDGRGSDDTRRLERYSGISPYPAVKRDLCIVVGGRATCADLQATITRQGKYLESIRLFDYYRGGHLGEGRRSYTFRLSFRSNEGPWTAPPWTERSSAFFRRSSASTRRP